MENWIKGNYRKSIYHNESGYNIGLFKLKETNDDELTDYIGRTITFTGYFSDLNQNDTYIFYGNHVVHEKYGDQFNVTKYENVLPEEKDGIVAFLSSGLFKGIGEKKAKTIVDVLGKDTLNIIINNPNNLLLVPGVNNKQVNILHNTLMDYQSSYETIVELNNRGFNAKDSIRIYNKYRASSLDKIKDNIYQLCEDFDDINFPKIDYIFLKMTNNRDDIRRIKAAILYVIDEVCNLYGHSYLLKEEIYNFVVRCLKNEMAPSEYDTSLEELEREEKIVRREEKYYIYKMFDAEKTIANRFRYLSNLTPFSDRNVSKEITKTGLAFSIVYNKDQLTAIKAALVSNICIITGGPGTGKTTIIKAITECYKNLNKLSYENLEKEIALLAPTGRAAKRIGESTLLPATTIHRFLKWNKETNKFAVNEYAKSDVKYVIIDESSMIDTYLLDSLLKGLKFDTRIILVGDANQLPSVGPGEVLKDAIASKEVTVIRLNELYRQVSDSNIVNLAYKVNAGETPKKIFNENEDLSFISCDSMVVKDNLLKICMELKKDNVSDFQVLAPMYKTVNGIDNLNVLLQGIFNPKDNKKNEILINGITFRENDKIIQLTNMPEENIFNGDIGTIDMIKNGEKKEIDINYDGNIVKFTPANFNKFKHAYAISIHKSQGSEFNTVIIPVVKGYNKMLYRKLIYTGITRAKKKLILIGELPALEMAIKNDRSDERRTSLKEMLNRSIK